MTRKLARVLGITGAVLALPPWLLAMNNCLYALSLPDSWTDLEAKGYAYDIILIVSVYVALALAGLIGSLLLFKKHTLAVALMLISGVLMSFLVLQWLTFYVSPVWPFIPAPLLLFAAGVLALMDKKPSEAH
ncbi:MAG: hypothetical protein PHO15_10515 [Eubacteriales bacterium]|nr:hypothetical protein [Eubacteriales bacterium]